MAHPRLLHVARCGDLSLCSNRAPGTVSSHCTPHTTRGPQYPSGPLQEMVATALSVRHRIKNNKWQGRAGAQNRGKACPAAPHTSWWLTERVLFPEAAWAHLPVSFQLCFLRHAKYIPLIELPQNKTKATHHWRGEVGLMERRGWTQEAPGESRGFREGWGTIHAPFIQPGSVPT